jgi:hypothetical protein
MRTHETTASTGGSGVQGFIGAQQHVGADPASPVSGFAAILVLGWSGGLPRSHWAARPHQSRILTFREVWTAWQRGEQWDLMTG